MLTTPIYSPAVVVKRGSIDQGERVEVPAGIDQAAHVVSVSRAPLAWLSPWSMGSSGGGFTTPIYSRPWC